MNCDAIIVGGGIVGLATAFRLLEARPQTKLLLLEKESRLAAHQTGNNSGVLHSGLYYKPGSEKAKLSVSGLREMVAFCQEPRHRARTMRQNRRRHRRGRIAAARKSLGARKCQRPARPAETKSAANQGNRTARRRHRRDSRPAGRHRGLSRRLRETRRTHPQGRRRNQTQCAGFENPSGRQRTSRRNLRREIFTQSSSSLAAGCTPTGSCARRGKNRPPKSSRSAASIFKSRRSASFSSAI